MFLSLPLLRSLSHLRPKNFLLCQRQTPISSSTVIVMSIAILWGWMNLSICLGEFNDVPVTRKPSGSLVVDRTPRRGTFIARCGRNFVDEPLYLGHLPLAVQREKESEGGIETSPSLPHPWLDPDVRVPAGCISVGYGDTAPFRCIVLNGIGASASRHDVRYWGPIPWAELGRTHPHCDYSRKFGTFEFPGVNWELLTACRPKSERESRAPYLRPTSGPTDPTMPGCRTPVLSGGGGGNKSGLKFIPSERRFVTGNGKNFAIVRSMTQPFHETGQKSNSELRLPNYSSCPPRLWIRAWDTVSSLLRLHLVFDE